MARRHREKYRPKQELSLELGGLGRELFVLENGGAHYVEEE